MRVLIAGASGGVGTRLVSLLEGRHDVVRVSRSAGIDVLSGSGLAAAMRGVEVVVDVTNVRTREPLEVMRLFESSSRLLAAAGRDAGVKHHITLSVVGADRMHSAYMRAKVAQERALAESQVPFTVLRATQFFEFVSGFDAAFGGAGGIRVPDANMQPIAVDDVVAALARLVSQVPANGILEVGGPEVMPIRVAVSRILDARGEERPVTASRDVAYFGGAIDTDTLVPRPESLRGRLGLGEWLLRNQG